MEGNPEIKISAIVIARNEERNIARCVDSLKWADEILVVDAESEDRTAQVAREHGARVIVRKWPGSCGLQFQFAISNALHDWIFILDSDEEVTPELKEEIRAVLKNKDSFKAYRIPRINFVLGKWFTRGRWKEKVVRLFHRDSLKYLESLFEKQEIKGPVGLFRSPIRHYMAEDFVNWWVRSIKLARAEGELAYLNGARFSGRKIISGFFKFLRRYLFKPGFIYGWAGFFVSFQRFLHVLACQASILELQAGLKKPDPPEKRVFR